MRRPSIILASATAILLAAALRVAAAPPPVTSPPSADLPIPRILHVILRPAPDPRCVEARPSTESPMLLEWWRQWWGAATSRRVERQTGPERPTRTPFYLRSPMLSGFFGWGEPDGCDDPAAQRKAQGETQRKTTSRHTPVTLPTSSDSATINAPSDRP